MRSIEDEQGRRWDVTVGRESYGLQVLLFFPDQGEGVRKAPLDATTGLEAVQELEGLSDQALRERLGASLPWDDGAP